MYKFPNRMLIGVVFGILMCFVFFTAVLQAQSIAVVSEEFAEAYTGPSNSAGIRAFFEEAEVIDIDAFDDNWLQFTYEGSKAYIPINSVTIIQAEALVSKNEVFLLVEPTPFSPVMNLVTMGTVLNAIGYYGDYFAVDHMGLTGYIHKNDILGGLLGFLQEYGPTPFALNLDYGNNLYHHASSPLIEAFEEYLTVINTNEGINLRTYPGTDAPVIATIPNGNKLEIVDLGTEWHFVTYHGEIGYVSAKYTSYSGDRQNNNIEAPLMFAQESGKGSQIVSYARQFLGSNYRWGGTSASSGFDCSGFVYTVYKHVGITLNRSSRDQIKNGTIVSRSDLVPGDLVFFATSGGSRISHVGIYIGNDEFIHSSSSKRRGVIISSMNDDYYRRTYVNACRVAS